MILGMYNTGSTTTATDIQQGPGSGGDTPLNWRNTRDNYMNPAKVKIRRTFNSTMPASFAASAGAGNDAQGIASFLSVKALPQDVNAGTYDASIDAIAAGAPAGTWLTFYHEPEDDAARGTFTAAQWSTAFQRFYTRVKAANPLVLVAPCHMTYQWGAGMSSTATQSAWSVAGKCDMICTDTYFMEFQTGFTTVANEPRHQRWHAWASTQGKPLGVTEFGVVGKYWTQNSAGVWSYIRPYTDAQRATLIGNSLDWFRNNNYAMVLYWNAYHGDYDTNATNTTNNVHNWRDWILTPTKSDTETKPLALAAWNDRVASYGSTVTTL
jgi:hypothetical protein